MVLTLQYSITSSIALIFYTHCFPCTNPSGLVVVTSFLCHIFTFCDNWCRAIWSTTSRVFEDSYKWRMFICVRVKRMLVVFGSSKQQEGKNCKEVPSTKLCSRASTLRRHIVTESFSTFERL